MVAYLYGPVHGFMLWNTFLATVPAVLALVLFPTIMQRGLAWWLGFVAWVLFLPNAPYLLTDVVHMVHDIRVSPSDGRAYLVIVIYGVQFAFGLASYALSLQLFRRFLHRTVPPRLVTPTILLIHALCVLAMYLGRFIRLNSWDAVLAPQRVLVSVMHVPRPITVVVMIVMFVVVGLGTFATAAIGDKLAVHARRWHLL